MANFRYVSSIAKKHVERAKALNLMHGTITSRSGNLIEVNGLQALNFANCSYLGLDSDESAIEAGCQALRNFGANLCVARTRLSIAPLVELEQKLAHLFGSRVVTFPSLTTTHLNVLPLMASGTLFSEEESSLGRIFAVDRFAHASMKFMLPFLKEEAEVIEVPHNDMTFLKLEIQKAKAQGKILIYICDSIYSMGGVAPINELIELLKEPHFKLYIDDAHGTSIFGDKGEGFVLSKLKTKFPSNLFLAFSLTKGFGCNGGGIAFASEETENNIRRFGQTYQFSGGMDFSAIGSSLEILKKHENGEIKELQKKLWDNTAYFDSLISTRHMNMTSPIRMIEVGDEDTCIDYGEELLKLGFYIPTAFFPVVSRGNAQLRICINAQHTKEQIKSLCDTLKKLVRPKA